MTNGQKLLELRRNEGMPSQAEMAWRVFGRDMSKESAQSKWSRLELDKQDMTIRELLGICNYFKLPITHFIKEGVVTSCNSENADERMDEVRAKVARLYENSNKDSAAVRTFEYGLRWIVDILEQEIMMREMLQKINTLLEDNLSFHDRITGMENDLSELKKLLKTETFDGKAGVGGL